MERETRCPGTCATPDAECESLENLDALIAAKTRQKQALMQQLLTGKTRVLSKNAFLDIELNAPPFEEQEAIGSILDTADQELTLLRTQRQTLDQQKRGLMQRLLTGKIRVKP